MRMLACCWLVLMAQCSRRSVCRADGGGGGGGSGGVHYAKVKLHPLASSPGAVAYAPAAADTPLPVISVPSVATCAELCSRAAGGTCHSFNFRNVPGSSSSSGSGASIGIGVGLDGDCELHATSVWDPQDLRAGPADNPRGMQMWIAATATETASYYRIIPTVVGYPDADEFSVWRTDCNDPAYVGSGSGSELSGILVGLRHGLVHTGTDDTHLEQVKGRMLRRSVGLDRRTRPTVRSYLPDNRLLACPAGSVITALAEQSIFDAADMIKCVRLTSPPPLTTLMLTDCYNVTLGGNSGKLLDPGMATPAATAWKAECGGSAGTQAGRQLEAMTNIRLDASNWALIVSFECCRIHVAP